MRFVAVIRPHWLALCSLAWCVLPAVPAAAAPSAASELAIQGVARDSFDLLIPAGSIAVRVYADSLADSLLYDSASEFNGAISQGIFDVIVGSTTPLMLDHDQSYFLELDVAGVEVIGDATAGGRQRFFPGGGSHARTDLEARIALLEAALGFSPQNAPLVAVRGRPVRVSGGEPRDAARVAPIGSLSAFSNQHGLLGFGVVSGTAGGYTAMGQLLAQPVGVRASGAVQAQLGPYYLYINLPTTAVDPGLSPPVLHLAISPNPSFGLTTLRFSLPQESGATLAIYDLAGRKMAEWQWASLPAGTHQIEWREQRATNGVLFARLTAGVQSRTQKLLRLQ